MRYILLALGSLFLFAGCVTDSGPVSGPEPLPEEVVREEKEPVKVVEQVPYLLKETSYFKDGFVDKYRVFLYSDENRLMKEELYDSFDEVLEFVSYEYDGEGRIRRVLFTSQGRVRSIRSYLYDEAGNPVEVAAYSAQEELQNVSRYQYDEAGRKIVWQVLDSSRIVLSETRYLWDGEVNTRIEIYGADGTLEDYFEKEHDSQGRLVSEVQYSAAGKPEKRVEYIYDESGLVLEKHYRGSGGLYRQISYLNDENGSSVKEIYLDSAGNEQDYIEREYRYEETVRWVTE